MVKIQFECWYCGYQWISKFYAEPKEVEMKCSKCGDSNIKLTKLESEKYYK